MGDTRASAVQAMLAAKARRQGLALLWQIYSRRRSLQIHFRQCGHRCGGSRAKSSRMAWRTAGKVGFDEKDRKDAAHAQRGRVYIPDGRQFTSLVTVEGGSIRLVTVYGKTAPQTDGH